METSMISLARRLFPICRSITGDGINQSFSIINEIHPEFKKISFKTGQAVFDWTIPEVWNIRNCFIEHESGQRFCSFHDSNLHVVGYSTPIDLVLDKSELVSHLHYREDLPTAIPYVTSYYRKTWGFCLSYETFKNLPDGKYRCFIDSTFSDGYLNLYEAVIPGQSSKEIFFSSYLCHPSMANNELSGPVLLTAILQYVKSLKHRKYTYRFVLLPETIGSIAYLSLRKSLLQSNMLAGFNLSCVGDDRHFTHLLSRTGKTIADEALNSALLGRPNHVKKSFLLRGSDERQYNSPLINLPVCGFSRTKFGEYPEYHTSLDDFSVVTSTGLQGSLDVFKEIVEAFELGIYPIVTVCCEPQLGKRGLYPSLSKHRSSTNRIVDDLSIRMNILAYSDGHHTIFQIAEICECSLKNIVDELLLLFNAGLIRFKTLL